MELNGRPSLPDVAREATDRKIDSAMPLEWVGMGGIEMPVWLSGEDGRFRQAAKVDAAVSLDRQAARGIHMSRLYLAVQEELAQADLSPAVLGRLVESFLASHKELSSSARVAVRLDWPVWRRALISDNGSWRSYPVVLGAEFREGRLQHTMEVLVTYSSTCPASAALSRRLIQEKFDRQFENEASKTDVRAWLGESAGMGATPHAQRSQARVKIEATDSLSLEELIDRIEDALQTAVQGAVKREDEQEFARRNAENLMFCEDAARRLGQALKQERRITAFVAEMRHLESLHPHDAMSMIRHGSISF